jgi:hypothetical protein
MTDEVAANGMLRAGLEGLGPFLGQGVQFALQSTHCDVAPPLADCNWLYYTQ